MDRPAPSRGIKRSRGDRDTESPIVAQILEDRRIERERANKGVLVG